MYGLMQPWQSIGTHRFRIEEDIVFVIAQGEITAEEIITLCEHCLLIYQKYGQVYEIVDATAGGSMSAEARRRYAEWFRSHPFQIQAVVFGASRLLRTVFALITNAMRLLGRSEVQTHFVATESEARSFVAQHRASHPKPPTP